MAPELSLGSDRFFEKFFFSGDSATCGRLWTPNRARSSSNLGGDDLQKIKEIHSGMIITITVSRW